MLHNFLGFFKRTLLILAREGEDGSYHILYGKHWTNRNAANWLTVENFCFYDLIGQKTKRNIEFWAKSTKHSKNTKTIHFKINLAFKFIFLKIVSLVLLNSYYFLRESSSCDIELKLLHDGEIVFGIFFNKWRVSL